jgi:DNA-binding response OmpR family regulator
MDDQRLGSRAAGMLLAAVQQRYMETKRTALLLEDEPLIAINVEMTLRDAGFDVSIVATCSDALEWLEVCRPDIVIVDIVLRDGPCHEVVEQLLTDGIPFVVHSGDHPSVHDGTPFAAGAWVNKPSEANELAATVRQLVAA